MTERIWKKWSSLDVEEQYEGKKGEKQFIQSYSPNMRQSKQGKILAKNDQKDPPDLDMTLSILLWVAWSSEDEWNPGNMTSPTGNRTNRTAGFHLLELTPNLGAEA